MTGFWPKCCCKVSDHAQALRHQGCNSPCRFCLFAANLRARLFPPPILQPNWKQNAYSSLGLLIGSLRSVSSGVSGRFRDGCGRLVVTRSVCGCCSCLTVTVFVCWRGTGTNCSISSLKMILVKSRNKICFFFQFFKFSNWLLNEIF